MLPAARDQFRRCQAASGFEVEVLHPNWSDAIANELNASARCPLIDEFGMMRDDEDLSPAILDRILHRHQPWLNLAKRNEVVRLVEDGSVSFGQNKMQNGVQANQGPLALGQFVEPKLSSSNEPSFERGRDRKSVVWGKRGELG